MFTVTQSPDNLDLLLGHWDTFLGTFLGCLGFSLVTWNTRLGHLGLSSGAFGILQALVRGTLGICDNSRLLTLEAYFDSHYKTDIYKHFCGPEDVHVKLITPYW